MLMVKSSAYTSIIDRSDPKDFERIKNVLGTIIGAEPTTLTPEDRSNLIEAILGDLKDGFRSDEELAGRDTGAGAGGSVWESWPDSLRTTALETVKILGRNPVGSELLGTNTYLQILLFQSGLLPTSSSLPASSSFIPAISLSLSTPGSTSIPIPTDPSSSSRIPTFNNNPEKIKGTKQAISILANSLRLHPLSIRRVIKLGGGVSILRSLGCDGNFIGSSLGSLKGGGNGRRGSQESDEVPNSTNSFQNGKGKDSLLKDGGCMDEEMIFLLGRCLFLLTGEKGDFLRVLVEEERGVEILNAVLQSFEIVPKSYAGMKEILLAVYNILVHYPRMLGEGIEWSEKFDILLPTLLNLLYTIPQDDLLSPLSNVINVLSAIPFSPSLRPIWTTTPPSSSAFISSSSLSSSMAEGGGQGSAGASTSALSTSPGRSTRKTLYDMFGGNPFSSSPLGRRLSPSSASGIGNGNGMPMGRSSSQQQRRSSSSSTSTSSASGSPIASGGIPLPSAINDPTIKTTSTSKPNPIISLALPKRLLSLLSSFFNLNIPPLPWTPGQPIPSKRLNGIQGFKELALDEILPPLVLLLTKGFEEVEEWREEGRRELVPEGMDRSSASLPLEKRPGTLGNLLRCMSAGGLPMLQKAIEEMLWQLSGRNADKLCQDIGYGNAAGILFLKGLSGPTTNNNVESSAHISELTPEEQEKHTSTSSSQFLDPITSLRQPLIPNPSPLDSMTPEERDLEADKLHYLFDRLSRNPVMNVENPMKSAVERGDFGEGSKWEKERGREEEEERRREEEEEERVVMREMEDYRKRKAKGSGSGN